MEEVEELVETGEKGASAAVASSAAWASSMMPCARTGTEKEEV